MTWLLMRSDMKSLPRANKSEHACCAAKNEAHKYMKYLTYYLLMQEIQIQVRNLGAQMLSREFCSSF